jgi:hypothetical protein
VPKKNSRRSSAAGLPDGFFSNKESQFGYILEGPRLENVNIFCGPLEYFTDYWDSFITIWYIFPTWVILAKKNLATLVIKWNFNAKFFRNSVKNLQARKN